MKKPIFLLTVLVASMSAHAAYIVKIPVEQASGGFLTDSSIAFVKPGDAGSNPVDPEVPATPENPAESPDDGSEVEPERNLVGTLDFGPVSGETNIFTSDKLNGFVLSTSTFAIKGELEHGRNYYISNNGNKECAFIADVCTMNKNCVYSKASLSGQYTILSVRPSEAAQCLTVRKDWVTGGNFLSGVMIYDNPKTE
ncbi:hypothetical protein N1E91_11330 [Pseudomonas aeruginosa]|uniref:hypothetical protein n=1 Tax=Pseudomonas tolaasii TaxID=29442 RepID=UPI0015A2E68E|nr:hypothetical protein [Pseudomonas tolaasii]MCS8129808.1 hypothetical protein [Pseudomonas aeruginosa]MCS9139042.1 hypothetical protein [Pseudomonas aeruginosa]MCS9211977.1 hypothetical protein [Pseudomonas aeruginosa]NWC42769.1 hypothetical protein [Pseudomonas tolaasii]HEJ6524387.1 hypothetical protein [Pseudomonas aeruginosa]